MLQHSYFEKGRREIHTSHVSCDRPYYHLCVTGRVDSVTICKTIRCICGDALINTPQSGRL